MESIIEDFSALAGSGMLTVTAQNTGGITADFSVIKFHLILIKYKCPHPYTYNMQ